MPDAIPSNEKERRGPSAADSRALEVAALQSMALALTLTMHNAVAAQQENHVLRMAMTTAASKAILAGQRAEAEELMKLADSRLAVPDFTGLIKEVKDYLEMIHHQLHTA